MGRDGRSPTALSAAPSPASLAVSRALAFEELRGYSVWQTCGRTSPPRVDLGGLRAGHVGGRDWPWPGRPRTPGELLG